ncbi:hypothetical protein V865_006171 [Kwoniella europaea PYCC6329]|uniref:VOC domain-containing protein n=1 Tax=Kwoniella europaea PYCC6329 TaxID=1423913 RepID=A0AAX4KNN7_9TREE
MPPYTPILLQHVNLPVPKGTLHLAQEFYGEVIGFENDPVPQLQRDILLWFRIGDGPQQIHVAFENISPDSKIISSRHPCFQLSSPEALLSLQRRIYEHKQSGAESSALECDQPGEENSGSKGVEYPTRFFVRDYAGNRLEFSAPK